MKVGIIAEDNSDVEVIREITLTLLRPHVMGFKRFVGDGCGKLRRKCAAWARILVHQGCAWIVVVHDLDKFDEKQLRADLTAAVAPCGASDSVVLIPMREIEAWLLYDSDAIAKAFRESQRPNVPGNPEILTDPKKHLRQLIWKKYRKNYLNTIHNAKIAKHINVGLLRKASSFTPHDAFAVRVKQTLK